MDELFKQFSKKIRIFFSQEEVEDPYEKNVSLIDVGFAVVSAIVSDFTSAKIQHAMPGIITDKAKEIQIQKKDRPILEMSEKLQIVGDTDYYVGWKTNGKMQIREEGDICRCYIYIRKSE